MGGPIDDKALDISLNALDDVVTTGSFGGTADFNPGSAQYNFPPATAMPPPSTEIAARRSGSALFAQRSTRKTPYEPPAESVPAAQQLGTPRPIRRLIQLD